MARARMPLLVAALVVVFSAARERPPLHLIAGTITEVDLSRSVTIVGEHLNPWGARFTIGATTVIDGDRDLIVPGRMVTVRFQLVGDRGMFAERIFVR